MAEYKQTLNLPQTSFAMKANLAQREPGYLQRWVDQDIYQQIRDARKDAKPFILHDGPPYANGDIHVGHALNKILKDIIIKAKTLSGFNAPYVPGWDCHGLPIELQVEKKIGKAGVKVDATTFRKKCREYAAKQIDIQRDSFKRLGVFGEWDNPYQTMDFHYEANIVRTLAAIIDKGHLQKGFKPVHWCTDCGSSLAEAEVEYKDKTSHAIDVCFPLVDAATWQNAFSTQQDVKDASVVIWTTTPWTLPANQAVAVGEEITYVMVNTQRGVIIVSEALQEDVLKRAELSGEVIARCEGKVLENLQVQHPFYDKQVPVVIGHHVTTESGTGLVHIAPAHGVEDFDVCQRYGIEVLNPVGSNGVFVPGTELVEGQYYAKANKTVIEALTDKKTLLHHEEFTHSYPHCWRHKTPLIFRATPQWFISMEKQGLRDKVMQAIPGVCWVPEWGQARIEAMIGNRPDWCISRQRTWGSPLPLFVHKETGELHPDTHALLHTIADHIEQGGIEAWFDAEPEVFLGEQAKDYDVVRDTLDVWFDSGVSYAAVLGAREGLHAPADLYLEGSDQHRGWFHTSLLASMAQHDQAPYQQVLTHGFTVDEKGHKMSKSLGNVVLPQEVTKTLGADILRLWAAMADYRGEIALSQNILKRTADIYRRIRNTARFMLANLNGFDPAQHCVPMEDMLSLDQWAVAQAKTIQADIQTAYDDYRFHVVIQKLHDFCAQDMGSFYLDIIKDRQYTCQADSVARRSAQTAMYHIMQAMVRWMAPVLSFTAEEVWEAIVGEQPHASVFLAEWYDGLQDLPANSAFSAEQWQHVIVVRDEVNKAIEAKRNEGGLGSALEVEVTVGVDGALYDVLTKLGDELRFVLITSKATLVRQTGDISVEVVASAAPKCVRCWHRREDIGQHADHPELCGRCVENVEGKGEERHYA